MLRWQLWDDELLRFGGLLSRKLLQHRARIAAKAVKSTMRRFDVFQHLWAAWRGLRIPNPRLSSQYFGGSVGTMICDVLGGSCHVICFCAGQGKRPNQLKTPCADLTCFNSSGLPGGPEDPKLTFKCSILRWQVWGDDLLRFGGLLPHKLLQNLARKAAKAVKGTMRRFAVFQHLWAAWRGLRIPNPRLSAQYFGGRCGAMICDVLGGSCHVICFCAGQGKRPNQLKTP